MSKKKGEISLIPVMFLNLHNILYNSFLFGDMTQQNILNQYFSKKYYMYYKTKLTWSWTLYNYTWACQWEKVQVGFREQYGSRSPLFTFFLQKVVKSLSTCVDSNKREQMCRVIRTNIVQKCKLVPFPYMDSCFHWVHVFW